MMRAPVNTAAANAPGPWGLRVIGGYKLLKALVLIVAGAVVFQLDASRVGTEVLRLATTLRLDPDSRLVQKVLQRLGNLDGTRLEEIGAGIFVYGLLYVVQGVGLLLQKRWAEYLVVVTTGFLIPVEAFELLRKPGPVKLLVLAVNLAIVAYLVARLRRERAIRESAPRGTSFSPSGRS
jgi:uncharacterized membrane protein (DUF2068 family)